MRIQLLLKGFLQRYVLNVEEQYFADETAKKIEKIVNQLKQLATEVTIVNYKEKVA